MTPIASSERQLWGGAFTVRLPVDCLDASQLRQVPDNQEVFLHPSHDQSLVLELLDRLPGADTAEAAARAFFADLAEANGATADAAGRAEVADCCVVQGAMGQFAHLVGLQVVSKFCESGRNAVQVHALLHRLPQFDCDLAVTLNHPVRVSPDSSSAVLLDPGSAWPPDEIIAMITGSLQLRDASVFAV